MNELDNLISQKEQQGVQAKKPKSDKLENLKLRRKKLETEIQIRQEKLDIVIQEIERLQDTAILGLLKEENITFSDLKVLIEQRKRRMKNED